MVPRCFELPRSRRKKRLVFPALQNGPLQNRTGRLLQRRIRSVGDADIEGGKDRTYRSVERLCHGAARDAPGIDNLPQQLTVFFWRSNDLRYVLRECFEVALEAAGAHRKGSIPPFQPDPNEAVRGIEQVGVVHLRPVMVVAGDPEDGDDDRAEFRLEVPSQRRRRERLEDGVERSGQVARLLPRRNHRATLLDEATEPFGGGRRGRRQRTGCFFPLAPVEPGGDFLELPAVGIEPEGGARVEGERSGDFLQIVAYQRRPPDRSGPDELLQ